MLTPDQIKFAMMETALSPEEIKERVEAARVSLDEVQKLRDAFDKKKQPVEWKRYDLVMDQIRSYCITLHYNSIAINIRNEKARRANST